MTNRIGIIDDNKVFRKISKLLILKSGFVEEGDMLFFENGKEAFDFIFENINNEPILPKTIFLDLNMPIMGGWEFLKHFRAIKKDHTYDPNIYILTSSVDIRDFDKAKSIKEVKGYLAKPISADDFFKILQNNGYSKYTNIYL
tara:strand:- start:66151 stop:66579 length:429 start_codon:yes stop_codon:yes gene_type:complete